MSKKITQAAGLLVVVLFNVQNVQAQEQTHTYSNSPGKGVYSIVRKDDKGLAINYSIDQFSTAEKLINGKPMHTVSISGIFLPNEAGHPDLPGNQRYIAIPQGSKAILKVVSFNTETFKGLDIAPAPVIPLDEVSKIGVPLEYEKNTAIYSSNSFYPANPVILSEAKKIRGVDVVSLGVMPFQYNPVTKDLIVYKDIQIEITFEGGNGHFGDDAYRSRWWEPILSDLILNYDQLPVIDANTIVRRNNDNLKIMADTGCEYAIIIPNAPEFKQWADSIKKFRTEQGILTHVFKLSSIGTSVTAIQNWVSDAYTTWDIKPAAMLILADYGANINSTVSSTTAPGFASDNYYADVTGDDLPDITFSRIVANNATQLQIMCSKFLNYERNPPTSASFYDKPSMAMGWQDDRWYQIATEILNGYLTSINKHPVRINALGSPANNTGNNVPNAGIWSTTDPSTLISYFGQSGLKYIPDKPGTLGGFTGGSATGINTAINNGSFIALHRDHGILNGWYDPSYTKTHMNSLTNIDNKLPFVFSINCNTGEYQNSTECFVEKFHRYTYSGQNSGALGAIAPSDVSYSFVNDIYLWGLFDNMWTGFMPAYSTNPASRDKRPAFASDAGKYFLAQSSWVDASAASAKVATYQLYHTFGDAFQWFYSEVPQTLTVVHNPVISNTEMYLGVSANAGSFIAVTQAGPNGPIILGTATGTGSPVTVPFKQPPTANLLVTVTKQDYFRHTSIVTLGSTTAINENPLSGNLDLSCYPNPFNHMTTISYLLGKEENVKLSVVDMLGKEVAVLIDNTSQSAGTHQVQFSGKDLPQGVYSCVLKTDLRVITRSLVVKE